VLATDPGTGRTEARAVTALIRGDGAKDLVEITVDVDGDRGNDTGTITATDGHPFWLPDVHRWVEAKDLEAGGLLRTAAGTYVQITAVRTWTEHRRVHNLTVADLHTYYVGEADAPVLVHNCIGDPAAQGGVYSLRDAGGNIVRTGRTNDLARRAGEHARADATSDFSFHAEYRTDVYAEQRGLEQVIWERNGRPTLPGVRRTSPIDPRRNFDTYMQAARRFLETRGG
jgi:hypothetical protein